jgi:hypothetical protein
MAKSKQWGKKAAVEAEPKSESEKKDDAKAARRKGPIAPIYKK